MLDVLYDFVRGPLVWAAFIIFIGGTLVKLIRLYLLSRQKDKVIYNHFGLSWALRSIVHFLLPLNRSVANRPIFSALAYAFHIFLLAAPILALAHAELIWQSWAINWPSLNETLIDYMAVIVILTGVALFVRRLIDPTVKLLTTPTDLALLVATIMPFLTGFLAYHQWALPYNVMVLVHILSAELVLILIPFTKLSHFALFFVTRGIIGMEFGVRRATKAW
jgi:nitrate reductase gamma subunit